ncbi:hypothetical protein [Poseidonibacter antarcticus]|uniref:hypothetical protein n=1 Tax=Poseidonibacter antarcticus TaxID=2478538 RepID=UPI0013CE6B85|nr:hypothetical protein [Poseidonibacter antarcticus]
MFSFSWCDEKYRKLPLNVNVDFSKKETVYEIDFQAPLNFWGSKVNFELWIDNGIKYSKETKEEKRISDYINKGISSDNLINKIKNQYFKFKITLIPLGWASTNIDILIPDYNLQKWNKIEFINRKKNEFILSIPLYGRIRNYHNKQIMTADLQRLRNYHIRIESLENVTIPKGMKTGLKIKNYNRKH